MNAIMGIVADIFSVVLTTTGIALLIDVLLPYKIGVAERAIGTLKLIGVTGPVVAVGAIAILVLIYSKK